MSQRKLTSFCEVCLNVGSGFVISSLAWAFVVCPLYGFEHDMGRNLQITAIFTAISIARGYVWRRIFNKEER